jgi:hypothetical protein
MNDDNLQDDAPDGSEETTSDERTEEVLAADDTGMVAQHVTMVVDDVERETAPDDDVERETP